MTLHEKGYCSICSGDPEARAQIDADLASGTPLRTVSRTRGVVRTTLRRHMAHVQGLEGRSGAAGPKDWTKETDFVALSRAAVRDPEAHREWRRRIEEDVAEVVAWREKMGYGSPPIVEDRPPVVTVSGGAGITRNDGARTARPNPQPTGKADTPGPEEPAGRGREVASSVVVRPGGR